MCSIFPNVHVINNIIYTYSMVDKLVGSFQGGLVVSMDPLFNSNFLCEKMSLYDTLLKMVEMI